MRKFHNFSSTLIHILREINFEDSRSAKYAFLTILETLNFDFWLILAFKSARIHKKSQFRASKCFKMAVFALLESPKLISRKI